MVDELTAWMEEKAYERAKAEYMEKLNEIRTEIEELDRYYDNDYFSINNCPMYKCNEVLLIIDKYRKGQEDANPLIPINFLTCDDITDIIDES